MDTFDLILRGFSATGQYFDEPGLIFVIVTLMLLVSLALINRNR